MTLLSYQENVAARAASLAAYRGASTPSSFGDAEAELRALLENCGLIDMSWQGKIVLSGEDRVRWLNGMVTNNIRDLAPNHGNYSFLLNAQGRIQADLSAYNRGEYILVTTDRSQLDAVTQIFDRYIIMDDVEVGNISDKLATLGLFGPSAAEVLAGAGLEIKHLQAGEITDIVWRDLGVSVARSPLPSMDGFEIWFAPAHTQKMWDLLIFTGAKASGTDAFEKYRILQGQPLFGVDIRDRDLPQETAQQYALNFSKGCYIGQEIVERVRSRGNVHRTFVGFHIEAAQEPQRGSKIQAQGKDVGELTSVASAAVTGAAQIFALGYIRREFAQPGTPVHVGESPATVQSLPFPR